MRFLLLTIILGLAGCSLFRDVDDVPRPSSDVEHPSDAGDAAATIVDVQTHDAVADLALDSSPSEDAASCRPIGDPCERSGTPCCIGECNVVTGFCQYEPCSSTADCELGLECTHDEKSVTLRSCREPQCGECSPGQWCHPVDGCLDGDVVTCASSSDCGPNEVCTSAGHCAIECDSSADCTDSSECVQVGAWGVWDEADAGSRICSARSCSCIEEEDFCRDGSCVRSTLVCADDLDQCPTGYVCGEEGDCVCDDALGSCFAECATADECSNYQQCEDGHCRQVPCVDSADCAGGTVCGYAPEFAADYPFICMRPIANAAGRGEACTTAIECEDGFCGDGLCQIPCRSSATCPDGMTCHAEGVFGTAAPAICRVRECAATSFFGNGCHVCQVNPSDGSEACMGWCWRGTECEEAEVCEFRKLLTIPGGIGPSMDIYGLVCDDAADSACPGACRPEQFCHGLAQFCVTPCVRDDQCPLEQTCLTDGEEIGSCVCTETSDCRGGETCRFDVGDGEYGFCIAD